MNKHKWQDAATGADSPQMALRVTAEEKQRLEELRQAFRLTSKGQVLRLALDLLELAAVPGTFMLEGSKGVRESQGMGEVLTDRIAGAVARRQLEQETAARDRDVSGSPATHGAAALELA